jgi:hypothetical protein
MSFLTDNWDILIALLSAELICAFAIYRFFGLPTDKQKEKISEWLIWACIEAEKALQAGTGQLKLREVWSRFCAVPAFTSVAKMITFETFSLWVTNSLKKAKEMLISNKNLADYVYGDTAEYEIAKIKEQLGTESQ